MTNHVQARWLETQTANQTVAVQVVVQGDDGPATWEFGDRTVDDAGQVVLPDRPNRLWAITRPDGTVETRAASDAGPGSLEAVMTEWLGDDLAREAVEQLVPAPAGGSEFTP
jgi:hypothetical protein